MNGLDALLEIQIHNANDIHKKSTWSGEAEIRCGFLLDVR
jgi:hypothetical protein